MIVYCKSMLLTFPDFVQEIIFEVPDVPASLPLELTIVTVPICVDKKIISGLRVIQKKISSIFKLLKFIDLTYNNL